MSQVFERAASSPLAAAIPTIEGATTFGAVIKALQDVAKGTGEEDTSASLRGQMQYGLRKRGQKARREINARARAIVARVDGDPTLLTDEERDVLKQYSGRGGIQGDNSLSEYYTPQPIAEGVWDMMNANGFENGNVLEPSTGAGVFMATKPAGVKMSGAEIDDTSASVTALLHPDDDVSNESFEQLCATAEDNTFDSVIGNVPFGDARGKWAKFDPEYQGIKEMERYFVTRAIDKVRHGGLVALIVPTNIISKRSKIFNQWRRDISRKAEFLGAHKLPSGTFGGANGNGTDTVVDVLIMRKHSRDLIEKIPDLSTDTLKSTAVYWDTFIGGRWFEREGKRFVHGEIVEGFRTTVESEIDNAGLKQLMARKFSSRIDYAGLDTAETITRNYKDGDRRVIGMRMHEMVAGEWQLVEASDGVLADGSLDAAMYGTDSTAEMRGILGDAPAGALAITAEQAHNAVRGMFGRSATQTVHNAVSLSLSADRGMEERTYRAALIGAEVNTYAREVSENGRADDAKRERLQRLVAAEAEKYGNPRNDSALLQAKGQGSNNIAAFARTMTPDGGFSDLLTGERDGERGQAYDTTNPEDVIRQLCVMSGAGPIDLEEVAGMYTGDTPLTVEALAQHDGIAITAEGMVQPMEYFASGNVVKKIASLERAAAVEENPAVAEKMRSQVAAINAKRTFTDVDNIAFSIRDKWFDRSLVERFLADSGFTDYYLDNETGEFKTFDDKPQRFTKQLMHYLNGKAITSSKSEIAAEYKQQARDIEEQFNVWVRQQDNIDDVVAQYNDVFNDYVPMEYDGSDLQLDNTADWITPHDFQSAAVRRLSDEGRGIMAFDVGLGKAQPLDAKLLTPYGWRLMGDIATGDYIIGADGNPARVTGVYPQGQKDIFEVVFSDGSKTRCCDEHLWHTQTEKDRKKERYSRRLGVERCEPGSVKSLAEIRETLVYQKQKNHRVPLVAPVNMPEADVLIPPYVLGVLAGDGSLSATAITFTPGDDAIAKRVTDMIVESGAPVEVRERATQEGAAATFGISRLNNTMPNVYHDKLAALGMMGALSHEKAIPSVYLHGSTEQRLDLLHGLMDTDGYVSKDGVTVQFSSSSPALASNVCQLVQSLGGVAWTSSKEPTYTYQGEKRAGRTSYTVSMRMPAEINPFHLPRKASRVLPKSKYAPTRYIVEVNQVESAPAQCIRVDNEDRLYVTDDYIVTHNTLSALSLAQYNAQKGRAKRTCVVVPKSVLENWYHETRQFHKNMEHVHFVGFTPKTKGDTVQREPVLDSEGNPKTNAKGETQYRDVLSEDDATTILEKMADIPQTSKTLVVMSRERFGMIPLRPDTRERYADRMVSRNLMSDSNAASLAQGEDVKLGRGGSYDDAKKTERYQEKFNDDGTQKKDAYPFYEDMGFDSVIVDEGHDYKNTYQAGGETQRLAYLPTPGPSKRSVDMAVKMDHLRGTNDGAGPVMLTATPVTNSPVEIYNMLSHIVPAEFFERMGIQNVDDFVQQFCSIEEVSRAKLSGEVVVEEGVAGFQNLDALRNLFHRFTNMKSAEDVNDDANSLNMPDSTEVHASVEMTAEQADIYEQLRQEADAINSEMEVVDEDGMVTTEEARPVFAIIRDMDRITTDMDLYLHTMTFTFPGKHREAVQALIDDLPKTVKRRLKDEETGETETVDMPLDKTFKFDDSAGPMTLVVSEYYEEEVVKRLKKFDIPQKDVAHPVMPKYAKLLDNLRREHENGGKQIVFTEEKSQHEKLKRIITHHLPIEAKEIGIINAETASGGNLEKISGAYNTGKSRIIVANKKAEVGVNLQKGTTAIHHLTLPWTPASIQQRNGRGVRQGNKSSNVNVIYYMGKGSFDGYRLESLKRKSTWIKDLFYGDAATATNANAGDDEDMAVLLAANPEEAKERMAEQRKRQEDAQRQRANKRATIDLTNLQRSKKFLADYDAAEKRAVELAQERGRDPEEARARQQERREKAKAEVQKIENRLKADQEKGRIDVDAKRLMHDGNYLTTLSGSIIEPGQIMESGKKGDLWRVSEVNAERDLVTLAPLLANVRSFDRRKVSSKKLAKYTAVQMTQEEIARHILTNDFMFGYAELPGVGATDAMTAELGVKLLNNMTSGALVIQDAEGELHVTSKREATDMVRQGGHVSAPKLGDKAWRDRLAEAGVKAQRGQNARAAGGLLKEILGDNWLDEAMQAFGNPAPDDVITEAATEALEAKLKSAQDSVIENVSGPLAMTINRGERISEGDVRGKYNRYFRMFTGAHFFAQSIPETLDRDLSDAGYDTNIDATRRLVLQQAEDYARRHEGFLEDQQQRMLDLAAAKNEELDAEDAEKREAARERMEGMRADMPEGVEAFFEDLGITAKLNATETTWQPKGGGRRKPRGTPTTSGPGERFMLFDPAGRGGPLAGALAGNKMLKSELGAVWTIFDGDLWWHMPTDGLDYDTLMGAF